MNPWLMILHVGVGVVLGILAMFLFKHKAFLQESTSHRIVAVSLVLLAGATVIVGANESKKIDSKIERSVNCNTILVEKNNEALTQLIQVFESLKTIMHTPYADRTEKDYNYAEKQIQDYLEIMQKLIHC